ncbi:hypothetical protein F5144DRAFT_292925 [Chaetomium tenue]|uniref:Uncharacterized protein n=1 Tax=Chaetomium tenue TaxID=1854479 RepID=A0ACB7P616_9PEZI|nr:hypothetical protein F5144DRAFT_292925 [Chaetomium globosum]
MEQNRRRDLERTQYDMLCALTEYIHERSPSILDDADLEALGVVRSTNLDVDSRYPCDFEPLFFPPCYDEDSGLEEEADQARKLWRETLDDQKHLDPEWVENAGYIYATMRAHWFDGVLARLQYDYDGEMHPIPRRYGFPAAPIGGEYSDTMYVPNYYRVPTAADKPHMGIIMLDSNVAPEGKMLWSEVDAAVTLLREQIRPGRFTDHHTKPALICTFEWETHARLTQAHLDAQTNKIIIRQSRQLDLRGKEPPPDAILLLRWLLNSPVGATRYEDEAVKGADDGDGGGKPVVVAGVGEGAAG